MHDIIYTGYIAAVYIICIHICAVYNIYRCIYCIQHIQYIPLYTAIQKGCPSITLNLTLARKDDGCAYESLGADNS